MRIGDRLCITPPGGDKAAERGVITVEVPLGAFGSGEHETTASCLEAIDGLSDIAGRDVLDVGSGTGILAVAALMLGADNAVCVDTSPRAATSTRRTAVANGVFPRVTAILGTLDAVAERSFELILANLHGDVLLSLAESIVGFAAPRATVILSGIAWQDAYPVRARFQSLGCEVVKERWLDEFVTTILCAGENNRR